MSIESSDYRLPSSTTLQNATKIAITSDKPVLFDYWTSSLDKTVLIGVRENSEKLLVRNEEEYTSPIISIYQVESDYLIETENSLYVVDSKIPTKKIS